MTRSYPGIFRPPSDDLYYNYNNQSYSSRAFFKIERHFPKGKS
jgi:hypothetical protein